MKDYYATLGVSKTASTDEIKRSFRRLANQYHPDRNHSKEAELFIVEVIEAYQVLEDPLQRSLYDKMLTRDESPPSTLRQPHRDPRYKSKKRNPNYKSEKQQTLELMQEWLPKALFISRFTLVVCLILSFDFTLPSKQEKEIIVGQKGTVVTNYYENKVTTSNGNEFTVKHGQGSHLTGGSSITVSYSPWMRVPLYLIRDDTPGRIKIPATIYGNFIFIPLMLMITSVLGVFWKEGVMFRFNLGVVNGILFFLTTIVLFIHHLKVS